MAGWLGSWLERTRRKAEALDSAPTPAPAPQVEPDTPLRLYRQGRLDEALLLAQQRLAADKDDTEGLQVAGRVALDRQQGAAALKNLEALAALQPPDADAWIELGRARALAGKRAAAAQAFAQAGQLQAGHPGLLSEQALLAVAAGKDADALRLLEGVQGRHPRAAHAHYELGNRALQRGQSDAAFEQFRRAVERDDRHAAAHANLGAALKDRRNLKLATTHLARALELDASLAQAAYNLAMLKVDQNEWGAAAGLLRQSLDIQPKQADAQYWLGNALMGSGDAVQARQAYQAALRLDANFVRARWGFVMAQLPAIAREPSEQEASAAAFARELEKLAAWLRLHRPSTAYQAVGAQQPYYLAYIEQDHRAVLREYGELCTSLMGAWARKMPVPKPAAHSEGKIRIGIVSAHIHNHSVWQAVLRGWVEHLDREQFTLEIFHVGEGRDAETDWAARHVKRLHQGLGDWMAWAKAVSDGRFDVLIYPEIGMDATTVRLSSLRLARVQLASWGHPLTTGLPTIDGYISAQAFEQEGSQAHYNEPLLALPRLGCSYRAYGTKPRPVDLAAWGVAPGDRVLLCAGNSFKYAPRDDQLYVEIARRCQPCKLLFFSQPGDLKAGMLKERMRQAFGAAGLDFDASVRFIPWLAQEQFFGLLKQAHVFLDSPGFSGFNTAMQAIECDTPIVAWEGRFMRGRFASAILRELELDEWVADSHAGFADRVLALCDDPARARVQQQLRERKARLFDDKDTVAALAAHLRGLAQGT